MKLTRRTWLLGLAGALAAIVLALLLTRQREPTYEGRPLSYWLSTIEVAPRVDRASLEWLQASNAVWQIGTNAIPQLLTVISLDSRPSRIRRFLSSRLEALPSAAVPAGLQNWADDREATITRAMQAELAFEMLDTNGVSAIPQLFALAMTTNEFLAPVATRATRALGSTGPQALPQLVQIITNPHALGRYEAMRALPWFGTNSLSAVPIVLQCIRDPAGEVSYGAASVLARMPGPVASRVAGLVDALQVENPMARAMAADELGLFGNKATNAIPQLRAALFDTNEYVRRCATNALLQIAPEALTNAPPR